MLRTEGWSNGGHQGGDSAWLFIRERMAHAFTDQYGILSLRPQPAEAGTAAAAPPQKTLAELFGIDPTAAQVEQSIATLPADRLADLVYWAGLSNVQFTPTLVKALMQVRSPLVRENCLAMLFYTEQPKEAAQAACESAYAATDAALQSPNVAILANLVNEKYEIGFAPEVTKLAADPDLTVAISAARALAKVGAAADIAPLEQAIAARIADLKGSATIPEMQRVGLVRTVEVFMQPSLEALKLRVEPIVIPTATPVVTVKAENTDLPRLMPHDNNNVYNAKGLLRLAEGWAEGTVAGGGRRRQGGGDRGQRPCVHRGAVRRQAVGAVPQPRHRRDDLETRDLPEGLETRRQRTNRHPTGGRQPCLLHPEDGRQL